jgi:hypothetical protein
MPTDRRTWFKAVLDPMERISEVLFGLIMVLTFTGSLSVASADRASASAMLIAALGCNLAWGIIDGGMYLMARLHEQGRKLLALRAVRDAADLMAAHRMITDELPPLLAPLIPLEQLESMRQRLRQLPEPPERPLASRRDWIGAAAVSLLVFLSTFPVVIPFILFSEVRLALRLSHAVAMAMLFVCGYAFGRCTGIRPWAVGVTMIAVGGVFAALAIVLGG